MTPRLQLLSVVVALGGLSVWAAPPSTDVEECRRERPAAHEDAPIDPFIPVPPAQQRTSRAARVRYNGYVSVQVNVNANGNNIVGDAANEPSIAIDPTNPARMAIGWRQFDTVESNFRQAGYAYTTDGGQTWAFPGVLTPGVFRSDPVLDADADGNFYYYTLRQDFDCQMFISNDGGASWTGPIDAYGGDKAWMTIDRTGGVGHGNIYCAWDYVGCCGDDWFTRSTDAGLTYMVPITIPLLPMWGTVAIGAGGEVYTVGLQYFSGSWFALTRSSNAQDPLAAPTFDLATQVNLGGRLMYPGAPNPGGLAGQVWVACDRSAGPYHGNVYVLCSVEPFQGGDPLDVMFVRSTDGGATWTAPVRVNDDGDSAAWQWFGTMSVAPNGRIDVIWNDTRNDPQGYRSQLYYAYSQDAGVTWSKNTALTPSWDPHVGWPNQDKIGDYYDMVSDDTGVNIAYAATFNGEQDVYFLRIGDCNGNGVHDGTDVDSGTSEDCNGNLRPDECDLADGASSDANGNGILDACEGCQTDEFSRFAAADGAYADSFGSALALDGNVAVVGASNDDDNGTSSGSAYVFRFDGSAWSQRAKLLPGDGAASDLFGHAVAISGDFVVAGADGDTDNGTNSGSAYVFHFDGNTWNEQAKLLPGDGTAGDHFGWSVAVDGDCAIIGAYTDDDQGEDAGSAYVFRYDGGAWTEEAKLVASDGAALDCFGVSVSLSGDVALIGAYGDSGHALDSGTAYVFRYDGQSWNEEAKLLASDGGHSDNFGWTVAIAGDTALIGVPRDDDQGYESGAAYVFIFDGAQWSEQAKLLPGAGGEAYDRFGCAVATAGDIAVIGAREYLGGARGPGAAYVFTRDAFGWFRQARLLASDGALGDRLGAAVAVSGTVALVGAPWADGGSAQDAGAVYVLRGVSDCNETGTLDLCDIADGTSTDTNGDGVPDECEGPGDLNCDGVVNLADVDPFVLALISAGNADPFDVYRAAYPYCDPLLGDINADGSVNTFDIDPFVDLLT